MFVPRVGEESSCALSLLGPCWLILNSSIDGYCVLVRQLLVDLSIYSTEPIFVTTLILVWKFWIRFSRFNSLSVLVVGFGSFKCWFKSWLPQWISLSWSFTNKKLTWHNSAEFLVFLVGLLCYMHDKFVLFFCSMNFLLILAFKALMLPLLIFIHPSKTKEWSSWNWQ